MLFCFRGLILALFSASVFAQAVQFGVVAGTNLTTSFSVLERSQPLLFGQTGTFRALPGPHQFIVGPKIELLLPKQFSVEADFLHPELSSLTSITTPPGYPQVIPSVNRVLSTWEFPVLGKYSRRKAPYQLFAAAGMSFRGVTQGVGLSNRGTAGSVGLQMPWQRLVIEPSLRYTRWQPSSSFSIPPSKLDQIELLVGFSFGREH